MYPNKPDFFCRQFQPTYIYQCLQHPLPTGLLQHILLLICYFTGAGKAGKRIKVVQIIVRAIEVIDQGNGRGVPENAQGEHRTSKNGAFQGKLAEKSYTEATGTQIQGE